MIRRISVW